MKHDLSAGDQAFRLAFEQLEVLPSEFDHRAHVRLAYIYLCGHSVDEAHGRMKRALLAFLDHVGAGEGKYHETLTRAWILAVRHFMICTGRCKSADQFLQHNPRLLDTRTLLSHYSREFLFSDRARARFVAPDLDPIADCVDAEQPRAEPWKSIP